MASLRETQAPTNPRANWMTPEQQLKRLHLPIAVEVQTGSPLFPEIAKIVSLYAGADESLTDWYRALSLLKALPERIPPLPQNIHEIMDSKCPIYGDQMQADGTFLKVKQTHLLSLVPEEFGTLEKLVTTILKPYAKKNYSSHENPLRFRQFPDRLTYLHAPFLKTHWVLMTKDILPKSKGKSREDQAVLIDDLNRKAGVVYETPALNQCFVATIVHKVATGKSLYQASCRDSNHFLTQTYTWLKDKGQNGYPLYLGGFAPTGVATYSFLDYGNIGVSLLRRF